MSARLRILRPPLALAVLIAVVTGVPLGNEPGAEIDVPHQKFVLDNGLTLIVHEDHKAPIVAVNVWYHVGSKNERPGKTGFAHLFEHLMFNGSEHYDDDYFQPLERVGATDMNGTTNNDRTNYFQNVPSSALDLVLWMESDRMGHMIGAITQAKLDEQRGVVQNEKRQGENQPYGRARILIAENTYPAGHPYSWSVIGSMDDLQAASLDDVHQWFRDYYGAANVVLSIAGDVDTADVKARVEAFFGDIPSGPPVERQQVRIAKRSGTQRQRIEDNVPQARVYNVWNVPQWGSAPSDYLSLVAGILGSGKTSRLYKRLVYDDQIATDVAAFVSVRELGGQFIIQATARPGVALVEVERAVDEELNRFMTQGPTRRELQLVKTRDEARFIRGIERIGGFGGKSDILAMNEVYGGSSELYRTRRERVREAETADLRAAATTWLSDGVYILQVQPTPRYTTRATRIDRSRLPEMGDPPEARFPALQRATLSSGLEVILAERHAVPVVDFDLLIDAGRAADQFAAPGTMALTMDMLDEGTTTRDALALSEELALLGARLGTSSGMDLSSVRFSALTSNLDPSLELFADVVLNPSFPQADFELRQQQALAAIRRAKSSPRAMGLRVLYGFVYGKDHAYGQPPNGTEDSVGSLTVDDLRRVHTTWLKPNNATLIVVGDTTLEEIVPKLEAVFGGWTRGEVPDKKIGEVTPASRSVIYLMDRPGAVQSVILASQMIPPKGHPDEIATETMIDVLGGSFTARMNMNLREDKHWSYGARSQVSSVRGQRLLTTVAPVQTDKTKEAVFEVVEEHRDITAARPPTADELARVQRRRTLSQSGRWETMGAVSRSIRQLVTHGLPDDYFQSYPDQLRALDLADVASAATRVIRPEGLTWIVVGDLEQIEAGVRELGLADVYVIDADGNIVR